MKDLEKELQDVIARLEVLQGLITESSVSHDEYTKMEERKSELIREVALAKGEECVVPLEVDCVVWSYGSPQPKVLMKNRSAYLMYLADSSFLEKELDCIDLSEEPESVHYAILSFLNTRYCRMGAPSEDDIENHPLWDKGLDGLDGGEVKNSKLIQTLSNMEGRELNEFWVSVKHYVFCFKDQMFECLSDGFSTRVFKGTENEVSAKGLHQI